MVVAADSVRVRIKRSWRVRIAAVVALILALLWLFYAYAPAGAGAAQIDIKKFTNGVDANTPTGPQIQVGNPVHWTYRVTNTGNVGLTNVAVTDDQGVAVSCPKTTLAVGEVMTCTANGTATAGQYAYLATATGVGPDGRQVSDSDTSHYFGLVKLGSQGVAEGSGAAAQGQVAPADAGAAQIGIKKYTNWNDADTPTGPHIPVGNPVHWTYEVTNTGDVELTEVAVTDDQGVAVSCPKTTLAAGESMTCTADGAAVAGQYASFGIVTGNTPDASQVSANDPSHYFGVEPGGTSSGAGTGAGTSTGAGTGAGTSSGGGRRGGRGGGGGGSTSTSGTGTGTGIDTGTGTGTGTGTDTGTGTGTGTDTGTGGGGGSGGTGGDAGGDPGHCEYVPQDQQWHWFPW